MSLLFYDSSTSTHLYEFIEYLIEFWSKKKSNFKVYFLLDEKIIKRVKTTISYSSNVSSFDNIIFVPIPILILKKYNSSHNLVYSSFSEEKYVNTFCMNNFIKEVCFLNLDFFQIILGINSFLPKRKYKISGILFSPYTFYPKHLFFLILRKKIQIFFLLRNKNINKIFILNDEESVKVLNYNHKTSVFSLLPDPLRSRSFNFLDMRNKLGINSNDFVLLSLGGFSYRKNILNIVEAFKNLPNDFIRGMKLIIAGQIHDVNYFHKVKIACGGNLQNNIFLIPDFLTNDEIESLISQSNAVLALYIGFYSSSGVVGNASKNFKPVIGSNEGVIGNIISNYQLGICTNPNSIDEISSSFTYLVDNYFWIIQNARFLDYNIRNDFNNFSEILLNKY